MAEKKKAVKLSIFLLKEGFELGDPIVAEGKMSESEVDIPNSGVGRLYIDRSKLHLPGWASFLDYATSVL